MTGVAMMRRAQQQIEEALRCPNCGKLRTERVTEWRNRGSGRSGESVSTALRFQQRTDATHCSCPPAPVVDPSIRSIPYLAPEVQSPWDCRNCGAGVDYRIDSCLLCGYTREKCTTCNGTGILDSGPHPVGCEEPCPCGEGLPSNEVGYHYPEPSGVRQ